MEEEIGLEVIKEYLENPEKAIKLIEKIPYISKIIDGVRNYLSRKKQYKKKVPSFFPGKILFVGGGELGTETAIKAREMEWEIRGANGINGRVPFEKIPRMMTPTLPFRVKFYKKIEDFPDAISILKYIKEEEPDMVVLENSFLTPAKWNQICDMYDAHEKHEKKPYRIVFVPTKEDVSSFLNKVKMKTFLEKKVGYILPYEEISLEEDVEEETAISVATFLEKHKDGVVLKPIITSSGHGQSYIKSPVDIGEAIKLARNNGRIINGTAIVEPILKNVAEAFVIALRPFSNLDSNPQFMGPIECNKAPERNRDLGGPVRLREAFFPPRNERIKRATERLLELTEKIVKEKKVPFLGVEYFIDTSEKIFVNEIVWRPDDMGVITTLAFEKSQFEAFMECLTGDTISKINPSKGNFACLSIQRESLPYYPLKPISESKEKLKSIIHFYNKPQPSPLKYQKIVAYAVGNLDDFGDLDNFKKHIEVVLRGEFHDEADSFIIG